MFATHFASPWRHFLSDPRPAHCPLAGRRVVFAMELLARARWQLVAGITSLASRLEMSRARMEQVWFSPFNLCAVFDLDTRVSPWGDKTHSRTNRAPNCTRLDHAQSSVLAEGVCSWAIAHSCLLSSLPVPA